MNFRKHSNLVGSHAVLSPSQHYWLNYTEQKLCDVFIAKLAAEKGTKMHDIAKKLIEESIKLPKSKRTFNSYVNDAIGFRMTPEVILYFSENCFGTADAISFDESKRFLRIHDLKTGKVQASMNQLLIYAALFCLEYGYSPRDITYELRIYQSDEIIVYNPSGEEIDTIINKIRDSDRIITKLKEEAGIDV